MPAAPSTSTEPAEAPAETLKPLTRSAVTFSEAKNNQWTATVPRNTTAEQLCQSGLWSVVSDQFRPYDRVQVVEASRAYFAELLVIDCGRGYCSMLLLNLWPLPALLVSNEGLPPGFDVFYSGPINTDGSGGYNVKRLADGVLIIRGKTSRDAALAALLDHATLK